MGETELQKAWRLLPKDALEATIETTLIPSLFNALGFDNNEYLPQYKTGKGEKKVDFAARKNTSQEDIFLNTGKNPELIIELKRRGLDLSYNSASYKKAVNQLQGYLHYSAVNNKSVKWGIITNGDNIQLFRKHGKVVYPYLINTRINADNIDEKVQLIKHHIDNPKKALSI